MYEQEGGGIAGGGPHPVWKGGKRYRKSDSQWGQTNVVGQAKNQTRHKTAYTSGRTRVAASVARDNKNGELGRRSAPAIEMAEWTEASN